MLKTKLRSIHYLPEIVVFGFAFLTRFIRLATPSTHIFDEVYHAFTAQQMWHGNPAAWEWWNTPPTGFAYEWTHPPLAKEFMVVGMMLFGENTLGWRFFSALFGLGSIILIYFIGRKLFNSRAAGLLAAAVASLDGLLLAMSRIAMNDSFFVFFSLSALLCLLSNRKVLTGLFLGLALASKWTGMYGIGVVLSLSVIFLAIEYKKQKLSKIQVLRQLFLLPVLYIALPILLYIGAYLPFFFGHSHHIPDLNRQAPLETNFEKLTIPQFTRGTNWETLIKLQEQMWWYHTRLHATHSYQSRPWKWMLDLRSVWFYVDYQPQSVASIFAIGNPLVFWFGLISIVFIVWEFLILAFGKAVRKHILILLSLFAAGIITKMLPYPFSYLVLLIPIATSIYGLYLHVLARSPKHSLIIIGYLGFFAPWFLSPRIMFLYHYTPAVPFLALASGYVLSQFLDEPMGKTFVKSYLVATAIVFVLMFPILTGIHVPSTWYDYFFVIKTWR